MVHTGQPVLCAVLEDASASQVCPFLQIHLYFLFEPGEIFDGSQPNASFATFGKSFCKSLTPETILNPEHTGQLVAFLSVR